MMRYSSDRGSRSRVRKSRFSRRNLLTGVISWVVKNNKALDADGGAEAHSKQYIKPPLGPRPISSITSSSDIKSLMSRSGS